MDHSNSMSEYWKARAAGGVIVWAVAYAVLGNSDLMEIGHVPLYRWGISLGLGVLFFLFGRDIGRWLYELVVS